MSSALCGVDRFSKVYILRNLRFSMSSFTRQLGTLKYSIFVVPKYWTLLSVGILWVLLSIWIDFEVPASGCVLVFCSIFAELHFRSEEWIYTSYESNFLAKSYEVTGDQLYDGRGHEVHLFEIGTSYQQANQVHFLKTRTRYLQFLSSKTAVSDMWSFNSAVSRIVLFNSSVSAIVAAAGTLLWGYGHLVF